MLTYSAGSGTFVSVVHTDEWAAFAESVGHSDGACLGHGGDGLIPGEPGNAVRLV